MTGSLSQQSTNRLQLLQECLMVYYVSEWNKAVQSNISLSLADNFD